MKLSLNQAAKEAKKSKKRILDALNNGELSEEKVNGKWEIDPSELFRVFPAETGSAKPVETERYPLGETAKTSEINALREQLHATQVSLAAAEAKSEAMSSHVDSLEKQLERAHEREQKLLAAPAEGKRGMFSRWFG